MVEEKFPVTEDPEARTDDPDSEVRDALESWLSRPQWKLKEVYDWLQGYYLPPLGHDDYPYVWVYRGLVLFDERGKAEAELTSRLSVALREKPDVMRPGTRPEEMLFNLLMLCASLSNSHLLGEPLLKIYERRALEGEWLGTDLRVALTSALISNQIDNRLQSIWQAMIEGRDTDFLIGSPKHGLDGIALMPNSDGEQHSPALPELGYALKAIARNLQAEPERRLEFATYVNEIVSTYPGRPSWAPDLVIVADKAKWPAWAVECLPDLCIRTEEEKDGRVCYLVWHYILACVPKRLDYDVVSGLCRNHILKTFVTQETSFFIETIAPVIEEARLKNPFASESSTHGVVAGVMTDLELQASHLFDSETAEELREARRNLLDHTLRSPNLRALGNAIKKISSSYELEQDRESMVLSLAKPLKALYPDIDLRQVAEKTHSPEWIVKSLKKAA